MKLKHAVVTGAHGFIGRHVSRLLAERDWSVIGIGHGGWVRDEWIRWGLARWHYSDVDLNAMVTYAEEPALIVHCAGSGSVGFSVRNPYQDCQRTVFTTLALLEFIRLHAPQARLVYPSSAAVYGAGAEQVPLAEADPLAPVSPYGVHKQMAEDLCVSYARSFGVSAVVVRLFSVYGTECRKQLLWDACRRFDRGENGFFGTGDEIRDWLSIDDTVELLLTAGDQASSQCPIANGGTGVGVPVREVVSEIFDGFERRGEAPRFSGSSREGDPSKYVADISRARSWGWQPKVGWRDGVREYVAWYRRQAT
jgi:UDP-glucose 4-epimerase